MTVFSDVEREVVFCWGAGGMAEIIGRVVRFQRILTMLRQKRC